MLFWLGNSIVALLFLVLMVLGLRRRAWMFALMNFIGMALDAAIVLLDILGQLNVTVLFFATPALAFVIATEVTMIIREPRTIAAPAAKQRAAAIDAPQDFLMVFDDKLMAAELNRNFALSSHDRAKALEWWKKGNQAFLQKNYQEAEAKYELSARLAHTPSALSNLAGILLATRRAETALQHCEAAGVMNAEHHEALINRGCALLQLDRVDEAIACFDHAAVLQPNTLAPWIYRGKTLRKRRQLRQAIECFNTALRINPNRPECWHEKALTLVALNEPEEALKCFDRLLQLQPDHREGIYQRDNLFQLMKTPNG
jgi:tetratricopeptide (TPR) repeat protein